MAQALLDVREKYMAIDMDGYLSKLVKPAAFTEMVARVLGGINRSKRVRKARSPHDPAIQIVLNRGVAAVYTAADLTSGAALIRRPP